MNYLKMNWGHTVHNTTRESPRYIFTVIIFKFFKKNLSPYYSFNFHFYNYYFEKKDPIFKANFIYIYILIIFVTLFFL